MSAAAEYIPSACFNNCLASRSRVRPAGVSDSPCAWWRRNNCTSNSRSMCDIAVEMAGCEMLARFDAKVMLPVSAAAMKKANCRRVNFILGAASAAHADYSDRLPGVPSWIAGHAESGCLAGGQGAAHIIVDLRSVNAPQRRQGGDGIRVTPIDPQVDDGPRHLAHHQESRRVNRAGFASALRARAQRGEQPRSEMSRRGFECGHHREGNIDASKQA